MTEKAESAGVIVFRETRGKREYLILLNRNDDWEFPKGGLEGAEELHQAALRELEEETGLSDVKLLDGFRKKYNYNFYGDEGIEINKDVHLFIGKAFSYNVTLSSEHRDFQWRTYDQALGTLSHNGPEEILRAADTFLDKNSESEFTRQEPIS
jgi:8-oxo-dGTP pyrophosphatase MutT (NUDIX family)